MQQVDSTPQTPLTGAETMIFSPIKSSKSKFPTWLILPGISVLAVLVLLVGGWMGEVLMRTQTPSEVPVDTSYPKLAADLNDRVTLALNPQANPQEASFLPGELTSNFNDQMNQGGVTDPTKPPGGFAPSPLGTQVLSKEVKQNSGNPFVVTQEPPRVPPTLTDIPTAPVPSETVADRFTDRINQMRRGGQVPPLPEIYDIEDVTPIGVVGDSRKREVMFYSAKTKQTFAAPLGTRFRNGTLEDASSDGNTVDGVRFRRDGTANLETRNWGSTQLGKPNETVEQPLLANEPVMVPGTPGRKPVRRAKN